MQHSRSSLLADEPQQICHRAGPFHPARQQSGPHLIEKNAIRGIAVTEIPPVGGVDMIGGIRLRDFGEQGSREGGGLVSTGTDAAPRPADLESRPRGTPAMASRGPGPARRDASESVKPIRWRWPWGDRRMACDAGCGPTTRRRRRRCCRGEGSRCGWRPAGIGRSCCCCCCCCCFCCSSSSSRLASSLSSSHLRRGPGRGAGPQGEGGDEQGEGGGFLSGLGFVTDHCTDSVTCTDTRWGVLLRVRRDARTRGVRAVRCKAMTAGWRENGPCHWRGEAAPSLH